MHGVKRESAQLLLVADNNVYRSSNEWQKQNTFARFFQAGQRKVISGLLRAREGVKKNIVCMAGARLLLACDTQGIISVHLYNIIKT